MGKKSERWRNIFERKNARQRRGIRCFEKCESTTGKSSWRGKSYPARIAGLNAGLTDVDSDALTHCV
jgi:hypothetical protein